jgi:hypothetical protein
VSAAPAGVNLSRDDLPLSSRPESVALGDLDGVHGKDIVVALPLAGAVAVLLNNGDGTFAAPKTYSAGPQCAGLAVDITLGDLTLPPDGKLDAYVACQPAVVRLTGDGAGALGNPQPLMIGVAQYNGTSDMLALMRRPNGNPVPLLVYQQQTATSSRVCVSYDPGVIDATCNPTPAGGPLAIGDLDGAAPDVPPDEIVTGLGGNQLGVFGFSPPPLMFNVSPRPVPGGFESAMIGDLDGDADNDVLVGAFLNSVNDRVDSIHFFKMGPPALDQFPTTLRSIPGLDAVAIADVDGDGCTDVVGAGGYGRGVIHLSDGAGGFDGGRDLPQLGYQNPATATRVTLAVGDLGGDARPELVVADNLGQSVMVFRNHSTPSGGACFVPPPPAPPVVVPVDTSPPAVIPAPPTPTPVPTPPRTCITPGTTKYTVGTPADDVLVGSSDRDVLSGRGGDDCLFGLTGDDRLTGGTGKDLLDGGSGGDRINGDAGDDKIRGGRGNDDITPGAGKDTVAAQGGDDVISARDSTTDTIDCGAGRDKVTADRTDVVKNCEYVKRAKRRG